MATKKPLHWRGQTEATRRMLCDGVASSSRCVLVQCCASSWLLLKRLLHCLLSVEAELHPCVLTHHPTAAVERCGLKSHTVWPCHGAGQCVHLAAYLAGSRILLHTCHPSPPLPSPTSLPLSLSCHATHFLIIVCTVFWKCSMMYKC